MIKLLGNVSVADLTPSTVETYKIERLKSVSPHTVNLEIRIINTALNQARKQEWFDVDDKLRFKLIRIPASNPPLFLSKEQIKKLLDTPDAEFKRFLQFCTYTGCRRNEVLEIIWDDIDLNRRQIIVQGEKAKMGHRRTIPINDTLLDVLNTWPGTNTGKLFPSYRPNQISMKFRRWKKQIGLPDRIHLHSLRDTFASHLLNNGVDIYTISKLLGHSSVKVTEKHYLSLDPKHVKDAVGKLNFD
ncbi:site-specific integrase [bacterium]|nr:site-specific integrase [bacterium]